MSSVALAAIMVAFFVLAIGLVRALDWMIDRDSDPGMAEEFADEPPATRPPGVPGSPR